MRINEFEFDDDDQDGMFMADNARLFMKLRQSERNRKQKMKEAAITVEPKKHPHPITKGVTNRVSKE